MNRNLWAFCSLYNLITIAFIAHAVSIHDSSGLAYVFYFPVFWVVSGIVLWMLYRAREISIKGRTAILLVFFSTPAPVIMLLFLYFYVGHFIYIVLGW